MKQRHIIRRAFEREEFLRSLEARTVRILSEYLEPESRLNHERIWHTIVFFGSARLVDGERARHELESLEASGASADLIALGRMRVDMSRYYDEARTLARLFTEWSLTLPEEERIVVTSGGGGGIMEAANRGASEAGGKTVAFNIRLPFEQDANQWVQETLTFDFHYFFMRKFWFVYRAKAAVVFPGGFGTLDELTELLTLTQTGRIDKRVPVIAYGREFWERVIDIRALAETGMISPEDVGLIEFADTPEEAFAALMKAFTYDPASDVARKTTTRT